METDPRGRGHFRKDVVIVQLDPVICRLGCFVRVGKRRTEAAAWIAFCAGLQLQLPDGRHYQEIAEIAVSRAAEMRVREPDYLLVVVLIARAVFVRVRVVFAVYVVRLLVSVGGKLHRPERQGGTGKRVTHFLRTDQRIDESYVVRA